MRQFCKKAKSGNGHEVIPYIVYDCSIADLTERATQAKRFNNASEVQAYIGIGRKMVPAYTSKEAVIERKRYYSKKLKGEFAIRIDTEKQIFLSK